MQKVGSTTDTADANGEWTNGNVAQGVSPTVINAAILNTHQRELVNIVESAGIQLDPNDDGQLLKAVKGIIQQTQSKQVRFESQATFTVPPGVTSILVSGCAGGGGGGGSGGSINSVGVGGGGAGGAAGQGILKQSFNVTPGSKITIAIGDKGTGGIIGTPTSNGGDGSSGGDTVIGSLVTLKGGIGGGGGERYSNSGTPGGGVCINGYPAGQDGQDGANGIIANGCGGCGGTSLFGGGAGGARAGSSGVSGKTAAGYGAGGGGAGAGYGGVSGGSNGGRGGDGSSGVVIIEW